MSKNYYLLKYLEKIKIEDKKYYPKFKLNYIIPGFYNFYVKFSDLISKNIKTDFAKNEKKLRNFLKGDKFEVKKKYHKIEENLLLLSYKELENDEFIFEFIKRVPSDLLLNDYITFYLNKYYSKADFDKMFNLNILSYNDNKHKLINILLNLRFNEKIEIVKKYKNDPLKLLLIKINWIESNVDYIIRIIKIKDILDNIFEGEKLVEIIEKTLSKENLRYITNENKNPDITMEVNECFYKILASICYSIIPPNIDFKDQILYYDYNVKKAFKIMKNLNDDLYTFSVEIDLIEELIQIYETLELNDKLDFNILNKICLCLKNINEILCSNMDIKSEELIDIYKKLYKLLIESLENNDKKYELLKFILYKETKKIPDIRYRTSIFQDVREEIEIIVNSNDILQILLNPLVNPDEMKFPKSIKNIKDSFDNDVALIIESILENEKDKSNIALSDTLLYYFEKNSFMYFNNVLNSKEEEEPILFDNDEEKPLKGPLKLFSECVVFLNDLKNNNDLKGANKNLCKLFSIGYIKSYCYNFIKLLDSCDTRLGKSSKIISEINKAEGLSKIISFYIRKIIYHRNKENIDIFIDPENIKRYKLKKYKCFENIESYENPFAYNYINPKDKEDYERFSQLLEQEKNNEFNNEKNEEFNQNKIDIDIFYFSSSNMILSHLKQKEFLENPMYANFYKNVCIPMFKVKEKILNGIKMLYDPQKYKKLKNELGLTPDNFNIILYSYRYFINELNSNSQNNIYSIFYNKYININKIDKYFYPGNDIKNIPIHNLYSKIKSHFKENRRQGCFVCLCNNGGYYHSIKEGIPGLNYLDLKCPNCNQKIGSFKNDRGFVKPIKRDGYYRIFENFEECKKDKKINNEYYNYNYMTLDEFKEKYIIEEYKKELGISYTDKNFFKNDAKIVRFLSPITYRILNFILYSHVLFSKLYNNNDGLDIYLPKDMKWIETLSENWEMIKTELNKIGINSIRIFMNYIFSDIFSALNEQTNIDKYDDLIIFEKKIDELIRKKIKSFKEEYKNFNNNLIGKDAENKFLFQNILDERYKELNEDEFPYYNYFYYSEYLNEDYLLSKLEHKDRDRYPVLLKVLENNNNKEKTSKYPLAKLAMFNDVLNLFNEKYSYSIKRDKANALKLKDEEIYVNNKDIIDKFIKFYNSLKMKSEINENILELSKDSKISNFFIDDANEIGKSYKYIYSQFINEQNDKISDLLNIKINNGIFEPNCLNKINIQSVNKNEIFITNIPQKYFIEIIFNSSYRNFALTNDYNNYNQIEVNLDLIEERMTEKFLKSKKLFDNTISNFVYANEDLEFENKDIISTFNNEYIIENINIADKKILYKFYEENKENMNLFKTIFNDFIHLILYLNHNKNLLKDKKKEAVIIKDNSKISEIFRITGEKLSNNFQNLFKNDSFLISKTTNLFEYYRNIIFKRIKLELKIYQNHLEKEKMDLIDNCLKDQEVIKKKVFITAVRSFIILFLNLEKDKENNIKLNQNNIINYFDIPDLWDKTIYSNKDFNKELNKLKKCNIKINQIVYLYDYLGDDINDDYFQDVRKAIKREEEIKNIQESKEPKEKEEENSDNDSSDSEEKDKTKGKNIKKGAKKTKQINSDSESGDEDRNYV